MIFGKKPVFQIRPANREDATSLLKIYTYYVLRTAATFDYQPPTLMEFMRMIEKISGIYPFLVITEQKEPIGYAYARCLSEKEAYKWSVELTIYMEPRHVGQGVGYKLYEALLRLLEKQGVQTAMACITHPNERSEQMHRTLGFETVAHWEKMGFKGGKWHDIVWMMKRLGAEDNPTPRLIPMSEFSEKEILELCHFEKV